MGICQHWKLLTEILSIRNYKLKPCAIKIGLDGIYLKKTQIKFICLAINLK